MFPMIIGLDHQLITLFNNMEPQGTDYIYDVLYHTSPPHQSLDQLGMYIHNNDTRSRVLSTMYHSKAERNGSLVPETTDRTLNGTYLHMIYICTYVMSSASQILATSTVQGTQSHKLKSSNHKEDQ